MVEFIKENGSAHLPAPSKIFLSHIKGRHIPGLRNGVSLILQLLGDRLGILGVRRHIHHTLLVLHLLERKIFDGAGRKNFPII